MSRRLGVGAALLVCLVACRENPPPRPAVEVAVYARPGAAAAFGTALDSVPSVAQRPLTPLQLEGQQAYTSFCWTCHGLYGHGDGPAARGFADPLTDLARVAGLRSDAEIMERMSRPRAPGAGGQAEPLWHALEPEAKRAAVAYLRSFAPTGSRGNPAAGRLVYATYCVHCHGVRGAGDGRLAPALGSRRASLLHFTLHGHEARVLATIRRGSIRHDAFMPEWGRAFTDPQLWDVVAYLQVLRATR
ncbi:MAG: c-type cytochrome [Gemmatimonadales bacterium]|nr:c-type cytochrome [Gemmatimonadales bacterium]